MKSFFVFIGSVVKLIYYRRVCRPFLLFCLYINQRQDNLNKAVLATRRKLLSKYFCLRGKIEAQEKKVRPRLNRWIFNWIFS